MRRRPRSLDRLHHSGVRAMKNLALLLFLFIVSTAAWKAWADLINPSPTSFIAGQVPGTATNDNATAGNVGEEIISTIARASAVSLTTATAANVTSISLTAGDWDVSATCAHALGATTNITILSCALSTTTNTFPATPAIGFAQRATAAFVPAVDATTNITPERFSLASTTIIYLVAKDTFTISTDGGYGTLRGRRVR